MDVDAYLDRIGFSGTVAHDLGTLEALQRTHLTTVAFENLDVYSRRPVRTDAEWSVAKVVERRRGGWCFEANGAFAALLEALGFGVVRLGATVLLGDPGDMIDHLAIEVRLDEPYLVDVGFGDSFIRPLAFNHTGPQDGGTGSFELIASDAATTLIQHTDTVPQPQYRFRRVDRDLAEFAPASEQLSSDPNLHWRTKPFATRLLDGGPDRVTLLGDRLKITRNGTTTETPVATQEWSDVLNEWFEMSMPEVDSVQEASN